MGLVRELRIDWVIEQVENQARRHPRLDGGVAIALVATVVLLIIVVRLRRPNAEEMERRRRDYLLRIGRLTDGLLVDARGRDGEDSTSATPEVLFYSYRLAGVTYNCAQDVSALPEQVRGYRLDQPVQLRYDARNPGNSILAAESWSGLQSLSRATTQASIAVNTTAVMK
jgi:hypothetical protein